MSLGTAKVGVLTLTAAIVAVFACSLAAMGTKVGGTSFAEAIVNKPTTPALPTPESFTNPIREQDEGPPEELLIAAVDPQNDLSSDKDTIVNQTTYELDKAMKMYGPEHPRVVALKRELAFDAASQKPVERVAWNPRVDFIPFATFQHNGTKISEVQQRQRTVRQPKKIEVTVSVVGKPDRLEEREAIVSRVLNETRLQPISDEYSFSTAGGTQLTKNDIRQRFEKGEQFSAVVLQKKSKLQDNFFSLLSKGAIVVMKPASAKRVTHPVKDNLGTWEDEF